MFLAIELASGGVRSAGFGILRESVEEIWDLRVGD